MPHGNGTERILFYCHDSYGLGHLRRTLALAHCWHARRPASGQLLVTGSPCANQFQLPEATDVVKLPAVVKVGGNVVVTRSSSESTRRWSGGRREATGRRRRNRPAFVGFSHHPRERCVLLPEDDARVRTSRAGPRPPRLPPRRARRATRSPTPAAARAPRTRSTRPRTALRTARG